MTEIKCEQISSNEKNLKKNQWRYRVKAKKMLKLDIFAIISFFYFFHFFFRCIFFSVWNCNITNRCFNTSTYIWQEISFHSPISLSNTKNFILSQNKTTHSHTTQKNQIKWKRKNSAAGSSVSLSLWPPLYLFVIFHFLNPKQCTT